MNVIKWVKRIFIALGVIFILVIGFSIIGFNNLQKVASIEHLKDVNIKEPMKTAIEMEEAYPELSQSKFFHSVQWDQYNKAILNSYILSRTNSNNQVFHIYNDIFFADQLAPQSVKETLNDFQKEQNEASQLTNIERDKILKGDFFYYVNDICGIAKSQNVPAIEYMLQQQVDNKQIRYGYGYSSRSLSIDEQKVINETYLEFFTTNKVTCS